MRESKKRSSVFDGLKGIAIISVIIYYYFGNWLPGGFLMVNLFFAVSGFLTIRKPTQLTLPAYLSYVAGKVKRMFFPLLFMVMGTAGYIYLFQRQYLFNLKGMGLSSLLFVNNYFQIFSKQSYFIQSMNPSPFVHLWYLSMHMQFVLLVPFLHRAFERLQLTYHRQLGAFVSLIGLSVIWMAVGYALMKEPTFVYYDVFSRMFAFLLGGLLLYLTAGRIERQAKSQTELVVVNLLSIPLLWSIGWMMRSWYGTQAFLYPWGMVLFTLIACVGIYLSQTQYSFLNYLVRFKPLVAIGKRSYALYLWFYPIHLLLPEHLKWAGQISYLIQWSLIGLLAELTYRYVEQNRNPFKIGPALDFKLLRHRKDMVSRYWAYYGVWALLIGVGMCGLLSAQANHGEQLAEIQQVIERNQAMTQNKTNSDTPTESVGDNQSTTTESLYQGPTFVGDSVLLAIADQLREAYPDAPIEGEVGRQLYTAYDALNYLHSIGRVGNTVVTFLGTNGNFNADQLYQYMTTAGLDKTFYFVTVAVNKEWETSVNTQLYQAAKQYPNVHIIDWKTQVDQHSDWLYEDGIHPNQAGAAALVSLIKEQVGTP